MPCSPISTRDRQNLGNKPRFADSPSGPALMEPTSSTSTRFLPVPPFAGTGCHCAALIIRGQIESDGLLTSYRTAVYTELTPKIGKAATRCWLVNLAWRVVLFVVALSAVIVAVSFKTAHAQVLKAVALVLVVALLGAIAVFLWTRRTYVHAVAEFLSVDHRAARKLPLRSPAHERWLEAQKRSSSA